MDTPSHPDPGGRDLGDVVAVMAVKRLEQAKTRLAAGRQPGQGPLHRALVLAMLTDTVETVSAAGITRIVVISPDDAVLAAAGAAGAVGVREPSESLSTGVSRLNLAFAHAASAVRDRWPAAGRVMFIQADLPAARAGSLRELIASAATHPHAVLTDRDGTGTTILLRATSVTEPPRFGPDSAVAHRSSGAVELDPHHERWPDLRTDVDTADDLEAARSLGLGPRTTAALEDRALHAEDTVPVGNGN
ncbi:2-phospho-L-lactate guanylyltransferase [Gordonia sp. SID5947]|uniref:2-phospho-L-lactate guanylyltransferase n=1 Tax=Gordonia sp. SID5947 TaxID=2690315 RepID=UPI001F02A5D3|nr:2-phospho-L-lactate guanylyltransferase [Gordonia sp. SID5947]